MRLLTTAIITIVVLVAAAALYIWSGAYNVAAAEPHSAAMEWLFSTMREQSVARHSGDIEPALQSELASVQAGANLYDGMCRMCHGALGHEPSEIGQGLNPQPPKLHTDIVQSASDAELYWMIENGIKMTGMPAFGPTHSQEQLWSIVAFVRRLPELQPESYAEMVSSGEGKQPAAEQHKQKQGSNGGHQHQ